MDSAKKHGLKIESTKHPLSLLLVTSVRICDFRCYIHTGGVGSGIERGLETLVEVGNGLMQIRDGRLYQETHATFEEYCKERWDGIGAMSTTR